MHQVVFFPMFHGDANTDIAEVEQMMPVDADVSDLYVRVSDAPRNGEWKFTIVGGGGSELSCTISGAGTSCSSADDGTNGAATFTGGTDLLALKADPDFSPKGGVHVRWTAAANIP